jgi:hypothetical protein
VYRPPPVVQEPVPLRAEPEPEPETETETELVVEVARPARPWPVGFAIAADIGWSLYPQRIGGGFSESGLGLGLGVGFVATPYFELRSRLALVTRSSADPEGGDDIEALTFTGGPRLRLPIRTVKDNQIALIFEAMGGWLSTSDAAGTSLGGSPVLEGAISVRLPARGGVILGVRGLLPLAQDARALTSVQFTLGGEFEMGPRFHHPIELPPLPRVHVPAIPTHVEVEVR